jgi:hypothetical protein
VSATELARKTARGELVWVSEALACFRWSNFVRATAGTVKPILSLNLDESSIKLCPVATRGYVIFDLRGRRTILRLGPRPSLNLRRSAVSLVSFLCDDPVVQPCLPHVFVSNTHVLSKADVAATNEACPRNVFCIRRKSSWVNTPLLLEILRLLVDCLGEVLRTHTVVLYMDACRTHLHRSVASVCAEVGIFVVFIPASTTAWLQPLDVCVFGRYKLWVARELERRRLATATGRLSRAEVMNVYTRGIPAIMESQSWVRAFQVTGLSGQEHLSMELMKRLQWDAAEGVPSNLPSLSDLRSIYPRGSTIPLEEIFALALQREELSLDRGRVLRLPQRARLPSRPPGETSRV